jgi:hypothetical protein
MEFIRRRLVTMRSRTVLISAALAATFASASYAETMPLLHLIASETKADLKAMEGKRVLGKSGELLGHIGRVDVQAKMAELKTPSGAIVSMSTDLLVDHGEALSAPMSRGDILAMIDRPGEEPNIREVGVTPSP